MRRRAWARGAGAGAAAVAIMAVLGATATAGAGSAEAAGTSAGDGSSDGVTVPMQVPATVVVTPAGPLTALGLGVQSVTCVQSPLAVDAAGRARALAPQVGVTVIRGSAAPGPSVSWVVVPAGQLQGEGSSVVTICTPSR